MVKASAPLGAIVSGGDYAVLYVDHVGRVVEDGTSLVVIDRRDTSHLVAVMERKMDDPKAAILFQ